MTRTMALVCLILSTAVIASACGRDAQGARKPAAATGMELHGDFSGSGPGTLHSASTLPTIDRRLSEITSIAARVEYTSSSGISDGQTQVTGTVFAPKGKAPDGGWPVIALGHATSGIQPDCAPSVSPSLLGLAPIVTMFVNAGYVVTLPDYQGLGNDQTYHPYLDSTTEGYNMIDSVRAARKLVADASDRWLALGVSQGGQAAFAANELAMDYGGDLRLVGSVSLAPPLDLTPLADAAAVGQLTTEQKAALQWILASLGKEYTDFNPDDYRHGIVADKWDMLSQCDMAGADARSRMLDQVTDDDLRPSSPQAVTILRGYLQKMSLPQGPTVAPMLVIYGGKDPFIPAEWTNRALAQACRMGDVIDIQFQPDKGHSDLDLASTFGWITARFLGERADNSCESPTAAPEQPQETDSSADPPG
jgi:pimeloyl-ACP methyl ester carboxylesterase